jgi:hypothetical protein
VLWNPVHEGVFRAVTHLDVSAADMDTAVGVAHDALRALGSAS